MGHVVAVQLLTLGEMVESSPSIQPGERLVIREHKLGHLGHGGGDEGPVGDYKRLLVI